MIVSVTTTTSSQKILSEKEICVLRLIASGFRNKDVAKEMKLSEQQVKNCMFGITKKLNVNNHTSAVVKSFELGLLSINKESNKENN
jgi:DNA-binding NarL/FixJ family response regulator